MSHHDKKLENKVIAPAQAEVADEPCQQRRRLLGLLGMGIAAAYVAPTLFSVGQAEAGNRYNKRGSYSRANYSRPRYSKYSGYDYRGRERSRIREYKKDPVLILEDVILGPPRR